MRCTGCLDSAEPGLNARAAQDSIGLVERGSRSKDCYDRAVDRCFGPPGEIDDWVAFVGRTEAATVGTAYRIA